MSEKFQWRVAYELTEAAPKGAGVFAGPIENERNARERYVLAKAGSNIKWVALQRTPLPLWESVEEFRKESVKAAEVDQTSEIG